MDRYSVQRTPDFAEVGLEPIKPRKGLILAASLVLGPLLSLIVVWLKRSLRDKVEDPEAIERSIGISVYGTVPHSDSESKLSRPINRGRHQPSILALEKDDDDTVESYKA